MHWAQRFKALHQMAINNKIDIKNLKNQMRAHFEPV